MPEAQVLDPTQGEIQALPPSSPPTFEHDSIVGQGGSHSPQVSDLLSPVARVPSPKTPKSTLSRLENPSSEYYTAAWGSPYEHSPSRSTYTALSDQIRSGEISESSPIPNFGLEDLIPSRLAPFVLPEPGLSPTEGQQASASVYDQQIEETPRSRERRWIQLPEPEEPPEKVHWWSDRPEHSESDNGQNRFRRTSSSVPLPESPRKQPKRHRSRTSNQTINQQSFWNELRDSGKDMSGLYASRWAATPPAEETPEKSAGSGLLASKWPATPAEMQQRKAEASVLTPPWAESPPLTKASPTEEGAERLLENTVMPRVSEPNGTSDQNTINHEAGHVATMNDAQVSGASPSNAEAEKNIREIEALPGPKINGEQSVKETAQVVHTPASPTKYRLDAPRLKKKVSWRGKTCIVSLPNVDYSALRLSAPLSDNRFQSRTDETEPPDSSTNDYDMPLGGAGTSDAVYSRPIFPDEDDARVVSNLADAKVRLPDLARWAAYMDHLTEQKLAALGVSLGSEDSLSIPSPTSRHSSAQYPPLPFSPAVPNSASATFGRPGLVRGHSHAMSVASPISPLNGPFGHMHRHSTFAGPIGIPQLQNPLYRADANGFRAFSPQDQRVGSPPVPGIQANSPFGRATLPGFNPIAPTAQLTALRRDITPVRGPGSPLTVQTGAQSTHEYNRSLAEDQLARQKAFSNIAPQNPLPNASGPNDPVVQPTPTLPQLTEEEEQTDNPAENFEAEPKKESNAQPKSEPSAYVPPHKRAELNANIAIPTPRGHRHNISEGLERDILESERRHEQDLQNYIEVEEEESSDQTSGTDNRPERSTRKIEKDPLSQDYPVQEALHSHKKSVSRFNVTAPVFKFNPGASFQPAAKPFTFGAAQQMPDEQSLPTRSRQTSQKISHSRQQSSGAFNVAAPEFKPAGFTALPKSEFSFSSNGPVFKPAATSFERSRVQEPDPRSGGSIFGKIEIPDFVKPARRSKAVAIRKPDEDSRDESASQSEVEDSEGRIAQSEDRLKRQRKFGGSGDEVPRFADPTPMPAPAAEFVLRSQSSELDSQANRFDKEVDISANESVSELAKDPVQSADDAFDRDFDLAYGQPTVSEQKAAQHTHKHSASLSALAKPFEPHSLLGTQKTNEDYIEVEEDESDLEEGELRESEDEQRVPSKPSPKQLDFDTEQHREYSPEIVHHQERRRDFGSPPIEELPDAEPSFAEIDAVMRQLNGVEEEQSAQEGASMSPLPPSPGSHPMPGVTYLAEWTRSDAPSPSPRRKPPQFNPQADSSFTIHERTDSGERAINDWPPVNRLNKAAELPTSDWSADFSVHDDEKLHQRSSVLDSHIDNLIGRVLDQRLAPLEESLRGIHQSIHKRQNSRDLVQKRSSSAIESDADDEDELSEEQRQRPISHGRDKRIDQIKVALLEALREQSPQRRSQPSNEMQDLHSYLADMKASFARAASSGLDLEDIRAVVEDASLKQCDTLMPVIAELGEKEKYHRRQKSELEARLNQTLAGMLEEANLKRVAEEREAESRRALQQAEDELRILRDSSRDDDSRLTTAEREKNDLELRLEQAQDTQRDLEEQIKNLEAENAATYATLEEYRMSSNKWRQHIDQATQERENIENQVAEMERQLEESQERCNQQRHDLDRAVTERDEFEKTIGGLERQLEESQESSGSNRRRLERLHSDMAVASGQFTSEKSIWKTREEEYRSKCDSLEAQLAAHVTSRAQLDEEVRELRVGAKEASDAKLVLDQVRTSHTSLEEIVRGLQKDLSEQQTLASRFERDFNEAKESGRAEVQRVRTTLEAELEAANHRVNSVRAELEGELMKSRVELDNVKLEAETTKSRHERVLEDGESAKREDIRKINQASSRALDEAQQNHENTLQEVHTAHSRTLKHALEDKERAEMFLNQRLALSDEKLELFQDKVLHLEEKLAVAKSAAQAAAQAVSMSAQSRSAPLSTAKATSYEKVSPQALRESILVLQEQLQEREALIEKLQSQSNNEAQSEAKSRDDEIAWLRELLAVRSEELTNLINALARPAFDRNAVRKAAIRIRANLQMEQQEKERTGQGQQSVSEQAIASLSNFATPKAAQLTTAFNKWRSNMESSALKHAERANARPRSNTPLTNSAPGKIPPSYMSGLMTPPASNLRATPSPEATASLPPPRLNSRSGSKGNNLSMSSPPKVKNRPASTTSETSTAPLFRTQSYDQDAEDSKVNMHTFEAEFDDDNLDEMPDNQPPAFRSLESELEDVGDEEAMA